MLSPAYSRTCLIEGQRGDIPSDFPEWPQARGACGGKALSSYGVGWDDPREALTEREAGGVACSEVGDG